MNGLDPRALLSELVAIPSVSGEEAALAERVGQHARALGLEHERVGDCVVLRVRRGSGPRLLLTSHLDTVPVGLGWEGDPFDGTWRDGRLVARGANDAKASVVGMLVAAARAAGERAFRGELLVALNACEETTNAGMQAVLERIETPDAAVVGEPTDLAVVRAQGGLAVLEARWEGVSCHAAHVARVPHENALVLAARELAALGEWLALPSQHPLFEATTVVATQLESGSRHNVVPDLARAVLDARLAPGHDARTVLARLRERLPRATLSVRSARLEPVDTPEDHPLVRLALELTGRERATGSSGLSDMALLGHVPAVKCGPGRTERSHTPGEFVTEEELLAGCSFYTSLVLRAAELPSLHAREAHA